MNTEIFTDKASMTSIEIAELVGSRPDSVKRTIETLAKKGIIQFPQTVEIENKQSPVSYTHLTLPTNREV